MSYFPLETQRLILRQVRSADAEAIATYQGLEEVARYCLWAPRSLERVRALVPRWLAMDGAAGDCEGVSYVIVLKATGELIGDGGLTFVDRSARQGEIGYVFHPAHHGRGYATEAMRAVLGAGFDIAGLHRVKATCDVRNTASWRVMEKLGMRKEAHFREHALFKGGWDEEYVYAILEDEWRARKATH